MDNVVVFPRGKNGSPPQSLEEIHAKLKENKEFFTDEFAQDLINFIVNEAYNAGYNLEEDDVETAAGFNLVFEAIRSAVLRLDNIWHPLQDVADNLYGPQDDDDLVVDSSGDMV